MTHYYYNVLMYPLVRLKSYTGLYMIQTRAVKLVQYLCQAGCGAVWVGYKTGSLNDRIFCSLIFKFLRGDDCSLCSRVTTTTLRSAPCM